jgi:hypothetical protein
MARSFLEASRAKRIPTIKRDLARRYIELDQLPPLDSGCGYGEQDIEEYYHLDVKSRELGFSLHWDLWQQNLHKVYCPGRILTVFHKPIFHGCLAVLLSARLAGAERPLVTVLAIPPALAEGVEKKPEEEPKKDAKPKLSIFRKKEDTVSQAIRELQIYGPDGRLLPPEEARQATTEERIVILEVPLTQVEAKFTKFSGELRDASKNQSSICSESIFLNFSSQQNLDFVLGHSSMRGRHRRGKAPWTGPVSGY